MTPKQAISAIEKKGLLLVYPVKNRKEPESLWSVAYPRSEMRWEWTNDGDNRVANLWHLREELSRSKRVVYAKWFQGRATFFSRDMFRALLANFQDFEKPLGLDARKILALLEESSPQSTKAIKRDAELQGRLLESTYSRAMKELWIRLLVVGFGEIEEGAFPSLAVGASRLLFEDLYLEAQEMKAAPIARVLEPLFGKCDSLARFLKRAQEQAGVRQR